MSPYTDITQIISEILISPPTIELYNTLNQCEQIKFMAQMHRMSSRRSNKVISMFKVTIKQYVILLYALILIAAVLNSGCISISNSDDTAQDVPVVKAEPETPKVIGTTVDGIDYYRASGLGDVDINGDMIFDFCDSAVDQNDAARHNDNIAIAIRANFGTQTDSKLHQDYPDIEEFRIRNWD